MTHIQSNFYRSPLFSDGELLLKAKQLRYELTSLWKELAALQESNEHLTEIRCKYETACAVANETQKVLDALEENGYECSGLFR
jgi:hypothetical protein